ncbi:arpA protein [Streptomyces sp. NPDC005438]|uniref:HalD/BesD family halogenase n=1 Tax=Streptomyces sp. NPDC005438 TaxID=3156880 RepID=UPI0033A2E54D
MNPSPAPTADPATGADHLVDTDRYPLHDLDGPRGRELVERARTELAALGCTVLRDFVRPERQEELGSRCAALAPHAYYDEETVNVYNIPVDAQLPADHPGRIPFTRGNAFVARDRIPSDSPLTQLYTSPAFQAFVARCFGLPELHQLADPLAGLVLNVVEPGMEHPWHFDTNEFTVTMLTQEPDPESGGIFEFCPGIRDAQRENLDAVRRVITGEGEELVHRLTLRPGDLQLFKGRYALHRVSRVHGDRARHSAIFAYSERPGVIGKLARTQQLFGRVLPEHLAADGAASDRVDPLLD